MPFDTEKKTTTPANQPGAEASPDALKKNNSAIKGMSLSQQQALTQPRNEASAAAVKVLLGNFGDLSAQHIKLDRGANTLALSTAKPDAAQYLMKLHEDATVKGAPASLVAQVVMSDGGTLGLQNVGITTLSSAKSPASEKKGDAAKQTSAAGPVSVSFYFERVTGERGRTEEDRGHAGR